jgi:hypothetical protein
MVEQCGDIKELFSDRGYLGDEAIDERRRAGTRVHCKPFPLRNAGRFTKNDFDIDLIAGTIRCANGVTVAASSGHTAHFPASHCAACPKRGLCTQASSDRGRSVTIHPQEAFLLDLRRTAKTAQGRASLRLRVAVEHGLATVHNRQGDRARYRGLRKNLFDLRRHAALTNLGVIDHLRHAA